MPETDRAQQSAGPSQGEPQREGEVSRWIDRIGGSGSILFLLSGPWNNISNDPRIFYAGALGLSIFVVRSGHRYIKDRSKDPVIGWMGITLVLALCWVVTHTVVTSKQRQALAGERSKADNQVSLTASAPVNDVGIAAQPKLSEKVDKVYVRFGGNRAAIDVEALKRHGWVGIWGFANDGDLSISYESGVIYVNCTLMGPNGPVSLTRNQITVRSPDLDRNATDRAYEVVESRTGEPIFQFVTASPGVFDIRGKFVNGDQVLYVNDVSAFQNPGPIEMPKLKPLFRYPSWKYPGQFAEDTK